MHKETINWGIFGTGKMANKMVEAFNFVQDSGLLAVASRSIEKASDFAKKWNISKFYGGYEELVKNPDIDAVYIATPVSQHYENICLCLNNGKNVLCEKPLTLNANQAKDVFDLAKKNNLFLMEAHWSQFLPGYKKIKELISNNIIGDIALTRAEFCHKPEFDKNNKWFNLNLGGGALLDLGVYPIGLALIASDFPEEIESETIIGETGVDVFNKITLKHKNNSYSELVCAINSNAPREAIIIGEKGYIKINAPFHNPQKLTLKLENQEEIEIDVHYEGNGYNYEIQEVNNCLRLNKTESEIFNSIDTINILKITDTVRKNCSLKYPQEV